MTPEPVKIGKNEGIVSLGDHAVSMDTWRALFGLGTAYSHTGRHHEAIALSERCVSTRPLSAPDTVLAMTSLAVTHHMLGNTRRAADLYTDILRAHQSQGRPEDSTTRRPRSPPSVTDLPLLCASAAPRIASASSTSLGVPGLTVTV